MTICNSLKERDFEGNVITSPCLPRLKDSINREHSHKLTFEDLFRRTTHSNDPYTKQIYIHLLIYKFPNKTSPQYEITFPKLAKTMRILSYRPSPSSTFPPVHQLFRSPLPLSLLSFFHLQRSRTRVHKSTRTDRLYKYLESTGRLLRVPMTLAGGGWRRERGG